MCGIAGFLGPWPEQLIDAMVASLRHRGPDGDGHIVDAEAGVALGHARLSIIDLTLSLDRCFKERLLNNASVSSQPKNE